MRKVLKFDWFGFSALLALLAIGTVAVWSAGNARAEAVFHGLWVRNLVAGCIGLGLYLVLAFADYRRWLVIVSVPAYCASVAFLVAVMLVGSEQFGGRRWLWFFQPSEVAKLGVIVLVATLFGGASSPLAAIRTKFVGLAVALGLLAVPVALILAEPDLGTALTLIPAVVAMLLVGGVWRRGLVTMLAIGCIGALTLLGAVYEAERPGVSPERRERILRYVPLKPHQRQRVKVFLFPDEDRLGAGYNLQQSLLSIGSGGFAGKGIGKGVSCHLKYLPQAIAMNDFIFCVWAEETGFVGSVALLALFGVLLLSGCRAAFCATDGRGRLLAVGVTALAFAHVYINIAMSVGLMPITGLPLPFISSGRTFLIVALCGFGIVQSVLINREENSR